MDPIEIGLWVSGFLMLLVVLGMRVAFAAGVAGLVGLIWIFWAKFGYDPARFGKALTIAVKTAGHGDTMTVLDIVQLVAMAAIPPENEPVEAGVPG